ncbi:MAG: imelysin family protein [Methylococcaceae bacterium]
MKHRLKTLVAAIGLVTASATTYAAPQEPGVVVTVEGTKVTAYWNPVIGASEYTLYYAPFPYQGKSTIGNIPMEAKTDVTVDLPVGASYYIAVKSKDASGESGRSNVELFTVETPNPEDADASISSIISSTATHVVLASYEDFATEAQGLADTLDTFKAAPTDDNLQKVQFAWRDTRRPWEQTESFLFGPVDTQGIDPAVDSWPVNRTDLEAVLNSSNALTLDFVAALDDTLHGFHTVEYVIFGADNDKKAADITEREMEYLTSSASLLHDQVNKLANAWRPTSGNFVNKFATAGQQGNKTYPSETSALQELVNGMIAIVDEVGNGKIADPFSKFDHELVESQFSFNSLLDFENNIRGVENIYLGRYLQNDGPGLNDLVRRNDADLDSQIRGKIDAAIDAIQAIPFPFRDSITDEQGRVLIEAAQEKVVELQTLLEGELATKISAFQ